MITQNILVAFANEKVSYTVTRMLMSGNMRPSYICTSASELKKKIHYYQSGIIISGYKLKDSSIVQFVDDIPDGFSVILIGNKAQIEMCESERIFKLAVPLQKEDLICSVSMLYNMQAKPRVNNIKFRSEEEERILRLAKETLIDRYNMTEENAHRYMQKKSMDTGTKLIDIAKIILN